MVVGVVVVVIIIIIIVVVVVVVLLCPPQWMDISTALVEEVMSENEPSTISHLPAEQNLEGQFHSNYYVAIAVHQSLCIQWTDFCQNRIF